MESAALEALLLRVPLPRASARRGPPLHLLWLRLLRRGLWEGASGGTCDAYEAGIL